ncbi:AAA family ATPase [Streptomyces sp. NPDC020965]|uniref:AAA family ATPase n=1 Tax=Streptomyces sp. NPDC020965 TaxID=3365105 RepID=UPI0037A1A693
MRLHRLTVTAFGPFGATQEVDFDSLSEGGIFLLHGPTGAGKTSVLDAVCFALYGAVPGARQSPGASLRSDHAEPGTPTEVLLELTVGGRRLEIRRSPAQPRPKKNGSGFTSERARSGLREYDAESGTWRALSGSHQEIGEEITQLVGMSRDQFCQVVLLPQGDFARFLRADAEARGRLLGRLFDTRRFAAVEERLGERRRAAEARVRAGDERLLAVAHRMAQAAGTAADDWPPPRQQPGDPGLADAVLEWAAVARAGALERADIADRALSSAESRQAAARRASDDARERDRLRRRYEEALSRHATVEAARPAYETRRARLDRARKAELVAPALRLREDAEREHRAAGTAHDRARAALSPDLAGAGADQLSALERGLRQELGDLAAARRAERRAEEIVRERAELDREARADDDLLGDAAGWLAEWDTLRRSHQDRVTAAQEAGTRSADLARLLDPARRGLRAARERDRLADRAREGETALRVARDLAGEARERWLDLKERRLRGIAAELATALTSGDPCAVCGGTEHPAPARATEDQVTPAEEDAAYEAYARADAAGAAAERELAVVREALAAAADEARAATAVRRDVPAAREALDRAGDRPRVTTPPAVAPAPGTAGGADTTPIADRPADPPRDPDQAELASLVAGLERDQGHAHRLASDTHAAREALDRAEQEHQRRLTERRHAERRAAARTERREGLDRERAGLADELDRVRGSDGTVAERVTVLERRARLLADAADAVRAFDLTALRLKQTDDRLADAAYRAGFATPAAAADVLLTDAEQRELQHRIDDWRTEAAAVADRLAEPEPRAAAEGPPADPEATRTVHALAERALRAADSALAAARARCAALAELSREAAAEVRRLGPLRDDYDRVARLAALTAGTSADNDRRMRLESYVLAARLEQVAAAATVRLRRMSSGRYTLVHSDARAGGKRSGLGLHVVDAWTGSERDTATLSGGETFFASLALALGLADVVTEEAGGVRLDTLFIDEGFGSLDEQTLDEVIDVLDSLREQDRSVGIVSHVADLRRRIPTQLDVVKERRGSVVRLRTAPLSG